MKNVRDWIIKGLYQNRLSKKSLLVMIYLIKYCDDKGNIDVYYKDIMSEIGLSKSRLYEVIKELASKEFYIEINNEDCWTPFLTVRKNVTYKNEMTITCMYNDFINLYGKTKVFTDYTSIDIEGLSISGLKKLSAGAIRTLLYCIFRTTKSRGNNHTKKELERKLAFGKDNTYKKIAAQLNTTPAMIRYYVKELERCGYISCATGKIKKYNNKYDVIDVKAGVYKPEKHRITEKKKIEKKETTLRHNSYLHFIQNTMRRKKCEATEQAKEDIASLMTQYALKASESCYKTIEAIIEKAFTIIKCNQISPTKVHSVVQALLKGNSNKIIVNY